MSNRLELSSRNHGGLRRWNQLDGVSAHLLQRDALWTLKGQEGVLGDVSVRAGLQHRRYSSKDKEHRPAAGS